MGARVRCLVAALVLGLASPVAAQEPGPAPPWPWRAPVPAPFRQEAAVSPAGAALTSLVLPGAGQHRLDQRRKWVYLAIEVTAWAFHFERRSRGADLRDRYRDLAWTEGRVRGEERVDGDFDYYETLSHWTRSGVFDADGAIAGIQPEPDPAAYNGFIWERAQGIFFPAGQTVEPGDPAYTQALDYYVRDAYGTGFLWDWSANPDAQLEFARLIERSDDRFRQATTVLGAVLLNHFVSAVDAFTSARTRHGLPLRFGALPDRRPGRMTLHVSVGTSP